MTITPEDLEQAGKESDEAVARAEFSGWTEEFIIASLYDPFQGPTNEWWLILMYVGCMPGRIANANAHYREHLLPLLQQEDTVEWIRRTATPGSYREHQPDRVNHPLTHAASLQVPRCFLCAFGLAQLAARCAREVELGADRATWSPFPLRPPPSWG